MVGSEDSPSALKIARQSFPEIEFRKFSAYENLRKLDPNIDCVIAIEVIKHLQRKMTPQQCHYFASLKSFRQANSNFGGQSSIVPEIPSGWG